MTIKKLAVLGSVLAGAVLLQNKERRGRLMQSATDLIHNARERLTRTVANVSDKAEEVSSSVGQPTGRFGETEVPKFSETTDHGRTGIY